MSCVRAIDFLTSQPDWDGKNVIVQGGSQGGANAIKVTDKTGDSMLVQLSEID